MEYRRLGKTGLDVSVIGLGTEYLVKATRETVVSVVHNAVSQGVNYFDVLFNYPEYRDNFGAAFKGIRDKVLITGHIVAGEEIGACRESFMDHLKRLQIDYADVIFVSCCDRDDIYERAIGPGGQLELARQFVKEGKARFIGFSSHTVPVASRAVKGDCFDLLMFPVNPAFDVLPGKSGEANLCDLWDDACNIDINSLGEGMIPERKELYHECARSGIGLIAMKPFAGGWLFNPNSGATMTPVQLINYALSQSGVTAVVPGASCVRELEEDLKYLSASREEKDYSQAVSSSKWNLRSTCMYCSHCLPCPSGIDVAEVSRITDAALKEATDGLKQRYASLAVKASDCTQCGICMERCPFGVDVISKLKTAVSTFEK